MKNYEHCLAIHFSWCVANDSTHYYRTLDFKTQLSLSVLLIEANFHSQVFIHHIMALQLSQISLDCALVLLYSPF